MLDKKRGLVDNDVEMEALQKEIEEYSLDTFTDPSKAFRRYPSLMKRWIQPAWK